MNWTPIIILASIVFLLLLLSKVNMNNKYFDGIFTGFVWAVGITYALVMVIQFCLNNKSELMKLMEFLKEII